MDTQPVVNAEPLHPRLVEIVEDMRRSREKVVSYARSLTPAQLTFRPTPAHWTALDIIEHLGAAEDSMGRVFSKLVKELLEAGSPAETETSSLLHVIDELQVVEAVQRISAPERLIPTGAYSIDAALERLAGTRERLLTAVHGASGLALDRVTFPHPIFGPLHAYAWLVFVGQHELRHLRQMRATIAQMSD